MQGMPVLCGRFVRGTVNTEWFNLIGKAVGNMHLLCLAVCMCGRLLFFLRSLFGFFSIAAFVFEPLILCLFWHEWEIDCNGYDMISVYRIEIRCVIMLILNWWYLNVLLCLLLQWSELWELFIHWQWHVEEWTGASVFSGIQINFSTCMKHVISMVTFNSTEIG